MKLPIVHAHNEPQSFITSMMDHTVKHLQRLGWEVQVSDLHAMGFNPVASAVDFGSRQNPDYLNAAHHLEHFENFGDFFMATFSSVGTSAKPGALQLSQGLAKNVGTCPHWSGSAFELALACGKNFLSIKLPTLGNIIIRDTRKAARNPPHPPTKTPAP